MTWIRRALAHNALWDPRSIGTDVWRQLGLEPSALSSEVAGMARFEGFKRCGGQDNSRTFAIDIWSQLYTVDDLRRNMAGADLVPIMIAGRDGWRYTPKSNHAGDRCGLIFPSNQGSFSITVLSLDPRSPVESCARANEVAIIVVPHLPALNTGNSPDAPSA